MRVNIVQEADTIDESAKGLVNLPVTEERA